MRSAHGLEADVWSLGCMLYTFLVGKPPFDTDAVRSTLNRVITAAFDLPDHLSDEAKDLLQCLLKKNPKDRIILSSKYIYKNRKRPLFWVIDIIKEIKDCDVKNLCIVNLMQMKVLLENNSDFSVWKKCEHVQFNNYTWSWIDVLNIFYLHYRCVDPSIHDQRCIKRI